jgi:hypothetical protein
VASGSPDSQIDQWQNPENVDIATISIGGNDLGFVDILNACVLWIRGPNLSGDCKSAIRRWRMVGAGEWQALENGRRWRRKGC